MLIATDPLIRSNVRRNIPFQVDSINLRVRPVLIAIYTKYDLESTCQAKHRQTTPRNK